MCSYVAQLPNIHNSKIAIPMKTELSSKIERNIYAGYVSENLTDNDLCSIIEPLI